MKKKKKKKQAYTPIKGMVINFESLKNKVASLAAFLEIQIKFTLMSL